MDAADGIHAGALSEVDANLLRGSFRIGQGHCHRADGVHVPLHIEGHKQAELASELPGSCALVPRAEGTPQVDCERSSLKIGSSSSNKTKCSLGQIPGIGESNDNQLK